MSAVLFAWMTKPSRGKRKCCNCPSNQIKVLQLGRGRKVSIPDVRQVLFQCSES